MDRTCGDHAVLMILGVGGGLIVSLCYGRSPANALHGARRGPLGEHASWWIGASMSQKKIENRGMYDVTGLFTESDPQEILSWHCSMQHVVRQLRAF
jgi:hypothetical protein